MPHACVRRVLLAKHVNGFPEYLSICREIDKRLFHYVYKKY